MLEVGNEAPKFSALDQDGNTLSLADFLGSWVLFWWYSKASTPGWTIQGQGLRDRASEFSNLGAVIVGASFDTVEEQKKFFEEQEFPFPLIADPEREIGELYGVARSVEDPAAAFPIRTSFLISPEGLVAAIWDQDSITDFQTHGDEVLSVIRSQSWEQGQIWFFH